MTWQLIPQCWCSNTKSIQSISLYLGTARISLPDDLSVRVLAFSWRSSVKYIGARPFNALYVIISVLNWIHLITRSQWSSFNVGVMWSYFRHPVITIYIKGLPTSELGSISCIIYPCLIILSNEISFMKWGCLSYLIIHCFWEKSLIQIP